MKLRHTLLAALLSITALMGGELRGQIDTIRGCDEIPQPGQGIACSICTFESLYGTTFGYTPSADAGWCGTIENDQYIGFVVGPTGSVVFEITTFNCTNGDGVQVAIYDEFNSLVGDCLNQVFPNQFPVFTANGLNPGNIYYIRIDGFAGDNCEFNITVLSGLSPAPPLPIENIEGPASTCTDVETTYYVEAGDLAIGYEWVISPGPLLGTVTLSDSLALTTQGTARTWLAVEVDGATSSLPPGQCDTLGLRVRPLSSCFVQDTLAYLNVNVCRASADRDTVARTILVPHCRARYTDTVTSRVYQPGIYYEPIIDANGHTDCNSISELTIETQGDRLVASTSGVRFYCDAPGTLMADVQGGIAPYRYQWRLNSIDLPDTNALLENVRNPGLYGVRITDALGCTTNAFKRVDSINAITDNFLATVRPTDCNEMDGAIYVDATFPQHFDLTWSTGVTDTAVIEDLSPGNYQLTLVESNSGCTIDTIFRVRMADSCYASVRGRVTMDTLIDCQSPIARFPVANARVDCSNGESVFTDQNGEYVFLLDVGVYTISLGGAPNLSFTPECAATRVVNVPSLGTRITGQDFYYSGPLLNDIVLTKFMQRPSRGRLMEVDIIATNYGLIAGDFLVTLTADPQQQYTLSRRPSVYDSVNHQLIFHVSGLQPGNSADLYSYWMVSQNAMLGDTIRMSATTDSITASIDIHPTDNMVFCQDTVIAAYDPNDKSVVPSGDGPEGFIETSDSVLQYTIRFENTGSADALYVRLEDQISDKLDLGTFQPLSASDTYRAHYNEDGRLFVEFEDIVLRPVSVDSLNAQGFFSYTIRQLPNLQPGDVINNTAEIYFDFNDPIITNTTVNTIARPVNTTDISPEERITVWPNPTTNLVNLALPSSAPVRSVSCYSITGKALGRVAHQQSGGRCSVDLASLQLANGAYTLHVVFEGGLSRDVQVLLQR